MVALVTGGAGFIGSNVADALLARGDEVRVLDDFSSGFGENVLSGAQVFEGDIADVDLLEKACDGVEVVFHLAALRSVFRSVEHPLPTDAANTHGTLALLDACRQAGVRRVVSASSSSVYGGADVRPTPESAPLLPRSPYAVSKLAGEHYCRVYAELYGLETVSMRYFNVYGPRQRPDSQYAAVIPLFIDALRHRQPPTVHGDGLQSRDFAFIDDVVAANLAAAQAPAKACSGRAFNIAGAAEHTLLDLLAILSEHLNISVDPRHVEPRPGDVRHTEADIGAARRDLGWEPRTSFAAGLGRTVEWFTR